MTWAEKRRTFFALAALVAMAAFAFFFLYPHLASPGDCFDGRQNGDESGVDCGGPCELVCTFETREVAVLWARAFEVSPGRFSAVAYLENKNRGKLARNAAYRFRFADRDNLYIGGREGTAFVPPEGRFAVFETGIELGQSVPVYTTFEFSSPPAWLNVSPGAPAAARISISDVRLEGEDATPRLSARISNASLFSIPDIYIVAIIYDERGNALGASRTFLEEMPGESVREIYFTWPRPFSGKVAAKEVIPMYDISSIKLR